MCKCCQIRPSRYPQILARKRRAVGFSYLRFRSRKQPPRVFKLRQRERVLKRQTRPTTTTITASKQRSVMCHWSVGCCLPPQSAYIFHRAPVLRAIKHERRERDTRYEKTKDLTTYRYIYTHTHSYQSILKCFLLFQRHVPRRIRFVLLPFRNEAASRGVRTKRIRDRSCRRRRSNAGKNRKRARARV